MLNPIDRGIQITQSMQQWSYSRKASVGFLFRGRWHPHCMHGYLGARGRHHHNILFLRVATKRPYIYIEQPRARGNHNLSLAYAARFDVLDKETVIISTANILHAISRTLRLTRWLH